MAWIAICDFPVPGFPKSRQYLDQLSLEEETFSADQSRNLRRWARLSTTSLNMASWCGKSGYSWSTGWAWRQPSLPSTSCMHHKWRMSCRESTKATMVVRKMEWWPLCSNWLLIWSQLPHLSGHRWTACTKCLMLGGMVLSSRCRSSQGSWWGWWTTRCWKKDWIEGWKAPLALCFLVFVVVWLCSYWRRARSSLCRSRLK